MKGPEGGGGRSFQEDSEKGKIKCCSREVKEEETTDEKNWKISNV